MAQHNIRAGAVAVQQALVVEHKLSYRQAAAVASIHPRTLWQHVNAAPGANVAPWTERPEDVRREATEEAAKLIESRLIRGCPVSGVLDLPTLCAAIAAGRHDIELTSFAQQLDLPDGWDWGDVRTLIERGETTADAVDSAVHCSTR